MKRSMYVFLGTLILLTACTKNFLDINTDPNYAAKTSENRMLTAAEQGLSYALGFTNDNRGARGLTEVLSVYMHQVCVREDQDQYGADGSDLNLTGSWTDMYSSSKAQVGSDVLGTLQNVETIISQGTTNGNMVYVGIAKIIKAYAISQFVDAFADIPYSEANQFLINGVPNGIRYPKYDKGADIYPKLFALLDEGIANLTVAAPNVLVPRGDDLFYGGDTDRWADLARTIKLKLYNQVRLVQNVSTQVAALESDNRMISQTANGFMFTYGRSTTPDDRNPGYNDYFATQRSHYMSPWFYEILKGYNKNIFTNNRDPRIPYYFYEQLHYNDEAENATDYRDSGFVSIVFGSVGVNRNFGQDGSLTIFGIYPVGGRYQSDTASLDASQATGAAPFRMLTYADRLYIEAELMSAGVLAGDARAKLVAAMTESFKQVDYVVTLASKQQGVPLIAGSTDEKVYTDKVLAEYDAGSAAKKLEIIMTQKWIQSFGNSVDQYTDYRRTGYPILFDPRNPQMAPGGFFQPPINGDPFNGGNQPAIPVTLSVNYPLSLPWSSLDLSVNQNAPKQKIPANYPVFWDKN